VKAYIHSGKLTAGHARMLIGAPNAEELAEQIVERGLNVRQVEAMAREANEKNKPRGGGRKARNATTKTADMLAFERKVSDATGLAVSIDHRDDHGTLTIRYSSLEQLDDLVQKLVRTP
jgi:ParB family chromosome partitioning protein